MKFSLPRRCHQNVESITRTEPKQMTLIKRRSFTSFIMNNEKALQDNWKPLRRREKNNATKINVPEQTSQQKLTFFLLAKYIVEIVFFPCQVSKSAIEVISKFSALLAVKPSSSHWAVKRDSPCCCAPPAIPKWLFNSQPDRERMKHVFMLIIEPSYFQRFLLSSR